jgi:hypothetical protein
MIPIRCKAGDRVKVRSAEEILAQLDENGCLDGMPFMPEMLKYCGQPYQVAASAHKTCDSTHYREGRYMEDTVFLENLRCDGSGHAGCEAQCLVFMKLAWLEPVAPLRDWKLPRRGGATPGRDRAWLQQTTERRGAEGQTLYRCQATEHLNASVAFPPNQLNLYLADLRSGNVTLGALLRGVSLLALWHLRRLPFAYRVWVGLYEKVHRAVYGSGAPHMQGRIPKGQPTPEVKLDVQPGEWVRVKPLSEINATLSFNNRNRGLAYNPEMSPFCGGVHKVERRITRIVDEKDGRLLEMKGPCILLEGGYCKSLYHPEALFCPKRIPQYFREAWLERTSGPSGPTGP